MPARAIQELKQRVVAYLGETSSAAVRLALNRFEACRFRPRLKANMTAAEANAAIDAELVRFAKCLRRRLKS